MIMYLIRPYIKSKCGPECGSQLSIETKSEELQESYKLFDDKRTPRIVMRVLFALWFTFFALAETIYFKYAITYYQYSPQQLSAGDAATLFTYSTVAYSVFRLCNVFVSIKYSINSIIKYHFVVLFVGLSLMVGAHFNYIALWVSGPVMMWGFAPMFAGTYTFASR